jgi:hypothetical protein
MVAMVVAAMVAMVVAVMVAMVVAVRTHMTMSLWRRAGRTWKPPTQPPAHYSRRTYGKSLL